MQDVHHIQYPVGQGGLHLGIIGDSAYIYDCGGYGVAVDWDDIFNNIYNYVKNKHSIHVFISHWHQDHCNHLQDLCAYLAKWGFKDNTSNTERKLTPFEQIAYLCEYRGTPEQYNDYYKIITSDVYKRHMFFVYNDSQKNKTIKQLSDYGLYPYTQNFSEEYTQKIMCSLMDRCGELCNKNIHNLIYNMKNYQFCIQVKPHYKIIKQQKHYTNHRYMLCLYCFNTTNSSNWLHTGDATMASKLYNQKMNDFYTTQKTPLRFANFIQIPHHASSRNHTNNFCNIFNKKHIKLLYYTCNRPQGLVTEKDSDIPIAKNKIRSVSNKPITKIQL